MDFIDDRLSAYCELYTDQESELLHNLNRQTHLKVNSPRMLSGHLQGRVLSFLSKISKPKYILEIGTYTGYSALCLAEGLLPGGKLISIDPNEETNLFAREYINKSPYREKIELLSGQAQTIIPNLNYNFDLVFIDADKKNYSLYYDLVLGKMNSGGIIIADNVLWSGKVLDKQMDEDTKSIHEFNIKISADTRVENTLLPIRDGLMLIRVR